MSLMRLADVNKQFANRGMVRCMNEMAKPMTGEKAFMHNAGIKTKKMMEVAGHEMKENPPKILAKTAKKFGKAKAKSQKVAIMMSKARQAGAKIPSNS